ncbi:A/G-specific adenine glycosylase, partial [Gammaproteobacteria bacterium]|nr:A/G-specific adenine glycosylase [Gammaproteobacteria bacterium]
MKQDFKKISSQVVDWYLKDGRHNLPWRKKVTPYRIWISEIMLQQTQVKTVIPYFNAFIKKYPTLQKLSLATEDEILASWSGLGFYRRAKNIFAAKEIIK